MRDSIPSCVLDVNSLAARFWLVPEQGLEGRQLGSVVVSMWLWETASAGVLVTGGGPARVCRIDCRRGSHCEGDRDPCRRDFTFNIWVESIVGHPNSGSVIPRCGCSE